MATLALEACVLHPRLNSDVLICAALLHDVGKLREFDLGAEIAFSEAGSLVGHVVLGQQMIVERAARLDGFPDVKLHAVLHCVLAHHGTDALPGRRFRTPEALALQRLNALDASVKGALEHGLDCPPAALDACPKPAPTRSCIRVRQPTKRGRMYEDAATAGASSAEVVEELLRQLVDARFVLTDRDGSITRWSRAAEELFGWPAPRMLGRPLAETLRLGTACPSAGGQVETSAQRKDGHELDVILTFVPVSMSQSLEFNGFLEALEIAAPRGNAMAQLQQSHHTVVEWIHAAVEGRAHLEEDGLSAGTIVAFRAVGDRGAPPLPGPEGEVREDAPATEAELAEVAEATPARSGAHRTRHRADLRRAG